MKKIILITGASSGMGKVTALDLLAQGHTVYCAARSLDKMKELKEAGGQLLEMDVADEASCEKGVARLLKKEKRIDVLWNNAGFGLYGPVEEVDLDKARYQFEVNLFGLAKLTQLVLPQMRAQNSGTIINTSSMGGKMYTPLGAWYHATKHAVEGFSDCLRLELEEFNINVVILEPGLIDTGFSAGVQSHFDDASRKGPYKKIVMGLINAVEKGAVKGSSPQIISDTIQEIIAADRPKTRYLVGKMAKRSVWARLLLGDRVFDNIIMKQFNYGKN